MKCLPFLDSKGVWQCRNCIGKAECHCEFDCAQCRIVFTGGPLTCCEAMLCNECGGLDHFDASPACVDKTDLPTQYLQATKGDN